MYCPFVTQPPVVPGECKSCGAVTNVHDDDCQYVEVKDEIGICSFCGQLDHTYAQCPEREEQREIAQKEREKDKMDKEKGKAKMKIVSGILTRQKDSDKGTPSETFNLPFTKPLVELACSFCGNNTHGHAECPVLHQYIRQQANELAAARASGHYPTPVTPLVPRGGQPTQDPQPRDDTRTPGKAPQRGGSFLCRGKIISPETEKIHRQRGGGNNLVYLLGGEVDHPQEVEGGPPDDGGGDDGKPREEEGDETDEDTFSITDSSTPGEPGRGNGAGGSPGGGVPQKTQIISLKGG